jgi:hypothetical protein
MSYIRTLSFKSKSVHAELAYSGNLLFSQTINNCGKVKRNGDVPMPQTRRRIVAGVHFRE